MLNNSEVFGEIRKPDIYNFIFPETKLGLVILWLYDKIEIQKSEESFFKEELIKKGFKEVYGHKNNENEDYSDKIVELLEHFLKYDEEEQLYLFQAHASEFCKMAYKLIHKRFKPSDIEIICRDCRTLLIEYRKEDYNLIDWFDKVFENFKSKLLEQTDFLDGQITRSIQDLSKKDLGQEPLLQMLRQFNNKMEEIKDNFIKLDNAYYETSKIKKILKEIKSESEDIEILNRIGLTLNFFKNIDAHLNIINRRINLILPKINQLFGLLTRPQFEAKIEKFIRFLLSESSIERDNSKKTLMLPSGIYPIAIRKTKNEFIVIENRGDLSPPKERTRKIPNQDAEKVKQARLPQVRQFDQQELIEKWFNKFDLELCSNEYKEKLFSPFFFEIFDNNWEHFELASKVAYKILGYYSNHAEWKVDISKEEIRHPTFKNLRIWEMKVLQRH